MAGNILGTLHKIYFVSDVIIPIIINIPKYYHFSIKKLRLIEVNYQLGLPGGSGGKEPARQCTNHKRCKLDPWVGKIPWRRAWQSTPVFLLGESHVRGAWWPTVRGVAKSRTQLKWLSRHACTAKEDLQSLNSVRYVQF